MWPLLLIVAAGAVLLTVVAYDRTVPRPARSLRRLLTVMRSAVFILLVLAIAGPVLSLLIKEHEPAELLVVIEDSGSMSIGDAAAGSPGQAGEPTSRWQDALDLAGTVTEAFAEHDPPVGVVYLRGNGLEPVREFRLDDPVIPEPTNHGTDLDGLLRQARDRTAGRSVRSLILISDGQETRGPAPADRRRPGSTAAVGRSTPARPGTGDLKVVGVGDPLGAADRVIKDLRYPDTAYEGDEVVVEFAVDHRFTENTAGTSLQVRLLGDEGLVAEQTLEINGRLVPLTLGFKPQGHGLKVYSLEVSPLDNERFLDNNRASLAIDVRKERSRLLLLTGTAGWDVRFLAQAAAGEERLRLEVVFPAANGLVFADSLTPWRAPEESSGWSEWDGVVISDWSGALAVQDWTSLKEAVEEGLGLLVVPGGKSDSVGNPSVPPTALAGLLPVEVAGWKWAGGPWFVALSAARSGHPVLEGVMGPQSASSRAGMPELPPLRYAVTAGAEPGAAVLLTAQRRDQDPGAGEMPLLVTVSRGQGRVAWFGGRHLWELAFWEASRTRPETPEAAMEDHDPPGRRLLRNLLVWTAAGEDNSGLVFTGRQTFFQEGERIKLAAQWRDMRGRPVSDRKLSVQLRRMDAAADSGRVRTFALSRTDRSAGFAEVALPPLPPGRYSVQLVGEGDPLVMGRIESLVVSGHSIESTQVRLDRRRLLQVAAGGGGQFHLGSSAEDRAELLADLRGLDWSGATVSRRNRFDFWSGWPFLVMVTILLGVEWFLRRRHGLL